MFPRIFLAAFALLLAACQTAQLSNDYDASRDFSAYRSWHWQEPALQYRPDAPPLKSDLNEQRVRTAVSQQLEQRGLRQAPAGAAADLKVQVWLLIENRQNQVSTGYGGAWGGYWNGYWASPTYTETRRIDYQVATLQLDLLDGKDGKLVWRGSVEQSMFSAPQTPAERDALIHTAVDKLLGQYPPH